MEKWMIAKVNWLSPENGGRKTLVPIVTFETTENRYCPIIKFTDEDSKIESWGSEIYVKTYTNEYESEVKISYLVDDAPYDQFQIGASFKLYEGRRLVATGSILGESVPDIGIDTK